MTKDTDAEQVPADPGDLTRRSWWGVLRRTVGQFNDNKLTDWAAALTYYSALSVFPALIVVTAVLGLLGPASTQSLIDTGRAIGPGSALAVLIWMAASAGFTLYVSFFDSYNKVNGSLAGAAIFLIWLWLTNLAVLLGAQFNAKLARGRRIEQSRPESADPILPPRESPDD